jgi:phosphate transport system substrate-binding protein
MRKIFTKVLGITVSALLISTLALVGCAPSNTTTGGSGSQTTIPPQDTPQSAPKDTPISVVSREDGSGTRSAFIELVGVIDADENDATTEDAVITNSTAVMMTTVSGDPNAIGYISMGSLNDTVKAVSVDGTTANTANVKNGSYKIQRPFVVADKGNLSPAAADFLKFIMSKDGQKIINDEGYIAVDENAAAYSASGLSGKVVVAGSSSVSPVMEVLIEAYETLNGNVDVELQTSDSSTGIKNVTDGVCDLGMASRELKDTEIAGGLTPTQIALDGIAVIVNKNASISNLSVDQIKEIFLGNVTDWGEVA